MPCSPITFGRVLRTGPAFPDCGEGIISIFPVTRQFEYKGISCSRTQFPLQLAYAITVYKSQGILLDAAVMNLKKKQYCLRLSYDSVTCKNSRWSGV